MGMPQRIGPWWMGLAVALAACEPEFETGGPLAPGDLDGLYEVTTHEVQLDCQGEATPVAELPMEEATPTTPFLILVYEPGPFGSTQLVALACDDQDMTCDVENDFRLFYDLYGQWKFVHTRGRPNDADGCDVETFVETLGASGDSDVVMELRINAGPVDLPAGESTCLVPVQNTQPEDLPCIRVERLVATRIER